MTGYHINPQTQKPGVCEAKPGNCRFKMDDGSEPQHYPTISDAYAGVEQELNDTYGTLPTSKTKANEQGRVTFKPGQYSGYQAFPSVEGVKIRMKGSDEILTIKVENKRLSAHGVIKGTAYAFNSKGERVPNYVPGPGYEIVSGPDTPEFHAEIKKKELMREVLEMRDEYDKAAQLINKRIIGFSDDVDDETYQTKAADSPVGTLTLTRGRDRKGEVFPTFTVYGANRDGAKGFSYTLQQDGTVASHNYTNRVKTDGTIERKPQQQSRHSIRAQKALEGLGKEKVDELFKLRRNFEEKSKELSVHRRFFRETYNDND